MKTYAVKLTASELKALEKLRTKKQEPTVNEFFKISLDSYWSAPRFLASGWKHDVELFFNKNIGPVFGEEKLSSVTQLSVKKWLTKFEEKRTAGNRSLAILSKLFSLAEEEGIISQNANPCRLVKKFPERSRKRYAYEAELKAIGIILERERAEYPAEVAFIRLLLLTGSRPSAIERLDPDKVERVDMNGETYGIFLFAGKTSETTGEEELMVLSPHAMEELKSFKKGTILPRYLWERVTAEANCPDLWARDLRRTFATLGLSHGVSEAIVGELLNHRDPRTTKIYAKLLDTKRMGATSQISAVMADLIHSKNER